MVNVFSPKIASESTQQTCKRARSSGCTLEATEGAILLPLHFFHTHTAPINIAQSSGYQEIRAFFFHLPHFPIALQSWIFSHTFSLKIGSL